MQIRSESASPNLSTILPNYAELQHLADPMKANLPNPIFPTTQSNTSASYLQSNYLFPLWFRSGQSALLQMCPQFRQIMPSSNTSLVLEEPISLLQIFPII